MIPLRQQSRKAEGVTMTIPGAPWRIVLFNTGAGFIPLIEELFYQCGRKLVGLVGAPGPRSRRTEDYFEIAQHARSGLDVIISNYPNRWTDMIRPLRPDLICVAGFN